MMQVTEYKTLGELPNPFVFEDGRQVRGVEDWPERRREIYKTAVELQYGTMPPAPEFLETERLYENGAGKMDVYRVTSGTRACPVSFNMYVRMPAGKGKHPVVISGDTCFLSPWNPEFQKAFVDEKMYLVLFDRVSIVPDNASSGRNAPLYRAYPDCTFGAIGAWAWGYSRCVDALLQLGIGDPDWIVFTGLSRGGKTCLLAGALDVRAAIVNPVATCAGGGACYRVHMKAMTEDGQQELRSETLEDLLSKFRFWMGPELGKYAQDESKLPFDCHFLKAMVAPRVLLESQAMSDIWANPIGAWQSSAAAQEVYKMFGCPENVQWYWRSGVHDQTPEDGQMLANLILHQKDGVPLHEKYGVLPFEAPEKLFHWGWTKGEK